MAEQDTRPVAIYLAGPNYDHEQNGGSLARGWRESVAESLPLNVLAVSPGHAFFGASAMTAAVLDRVERHMVVACDGVLAFIPEEVPVFGTIREIEFARMNHKPVAVVGDVQSLMAHDVFVVASAHEGIEVLLDAIREQRDTPQGLMIVLGQGPMPHQPDEDDNLL